MHKIHAILIGLIIGIFFALPSHARPRNIYCTGGIDVDHQRLMVDFLANKKELSVNGDIHYLQDAKTEKYSGALYTYNYVNNDGEMVYLALLLTTKGAHQGMQLAQYNAYTNELRQITPLTCESGS